MSAARPDPRLLPPRWDPARAARRRPVVLLVALAIPLAAWYFGWLLQPDRVGHPLLFALLVAAELFNLCQAAGFWWTVRRARTPRRAPRLRERVAVDVLIPVYDEPVEVVEPTVAGALAMRGAEVNVFVCDDGQRDEMREMAERQGAEYLRRPDRNGAKAGNINAALARTSAPFVVVFDSDHVARPDFLERTLGELGDERVAFVQTPQYYGNSRQGGIAAASWAQQALFFGAIARGKDGHEAMFCCGTNVVFRRAALEAVGGFPTDSVTEDFELSIELHERGWRTRYVPEVLAVGLGPEDMSSWVSQQQRWARGCLGAVASALRARLPTRLRLQYLLSSMYFLSGWTLLVYMSFPAIRILTGAQPIAAGFADEFLIHFGPYFAMALATVAVAGAGAYSFAGFSLAAAGFWIHVQATLRALLSRPAAFVVTPKQGAAQRQPRAALPALAAIAGLVGVAAYGLLRDRTPATLNNVAFASLHVGVLLSGAWAALTRRAPKPSERRREARAPRREPLPWRPRPRHAPAVAAALAAIAAFAWIGLGGGMVRPAGEPRSGPATAAAEDFLGRYLSPEGRVVRHDQDGDTVSEGQAYAMLLTAALGDRERFRLAWSWTRTKLQRPDGLLAWRWGGGEVLDRNPATDADLDASHALLLASRRFGHAGYRHQALRIARAILRKETARIESRPVLVAGPWARGRPAVVNPSYFSPRAYAALAHASGDRRWLALGKSSRELAASLTRRAPSLPPDWARVGQRGAVAPTGAPAPPGASAAAPRYGFDAVRLPVRMAQACTRPERHLAARAWPFLRRESRGRLSAEYDLRGEPLGAGTHAAALVAAAGAADAAGNARARTDLLGRAEAADEAAPSYYGSAWVALGRMMLTTERFGSCSGPLGRPAREAPQARGPGGTGRWVEGDRPVSP